jgi:diaminopimelate epimerase
MNFYNPDASQSFCGNGSRCAVRFAQSLGVVGIEGNFSAIDGDHDFKSDIDNVSIKMNDVLGIEKDGDHFILNTGSPHYVIYKNDIHELNITSEAHAIRYGQKFKERGINVNFVKEQDHSIDMRTYERGVEDETLSCGTGVTAAAITFGFKHPEISSLDVMTRGGKLVVSFEQDRSGGFSNIWLSGTAQLVYKGEIELP